MVGSRRSVAREVLGAGQLVEPEPAMVTSRTRPADRRTSRRGREVTQTCGCMRIPASRPDDVLALLDHRPPPGALDVVLQLDAQGPVVPDRVDAAVDLARREDEAAPLGERDDRLQVRDGGRDRHPDRVEGSGRSRGAPMGDRPWKGRSLGLVGRAAKATRARPPDDPPGAGSGRTSRNSRTTFSPMTMRIAGSSRPASSSASVSDPVSDASNGTGTPPSQSEPSATCSRPDQRRPRRAIARATAADVRAAGHGVPEPDAQQAAGGRDARAPPRR